jgi:hypothetical protein
MSMGIGASSGMTGAFNYAGATSSKNASAGSRNSGASSAVADFNSIAGTGLTPAQRMRNLFLAQMGLKEEDLKSMDPKQREAVEQKIRDKIQEGAVHATDKQKTTGLITDITA